MGLLIVRTTIEYLIIGSGIRNYDPAGKLQASSLTAGPRDDRMNLERNNMDTTQLKRIADALEEILRLVKEDQEKMRKIRDE